MNILDLKTLTFNIPWYFTSSSCLKFLWPRSNDLYCNSCICYMTLWSWTTDQVTYKLMAVWNAMHTAREHENGSTKILCKTTPTSQLRNTFKSTNKLQIRISLTHSYNQHSSTGAKSIDTQDLLVWQQLCRIIVQSSHKWQINRERSRECTYPGADTFLLSCWTHIFCSSADVAINSISLAAWTSGFTAIT